MAATSLTDEQCRTALDALEAHNGNQSAAAVSLNMNRATFLHWVREGRRRFREFEVTRKTTATDGDGNVTGTYTQEKPDRGPGAPEILPGFVPVRRTIHRVGGEVVEDWEQQAPDAAAKSQALHTMLDAMAAELPRVAPIDGPSQTLDHLLTLYTFTDYHVGMLAWHKEGGADWDVAIAERTGVDAMQAMVSGSPASHTAVVNIQGDFMHWDGLQAVTPTHGHVLDADSRFGRVVDVSIRLIRQLVALALQKHQNVVLLICEGNHDLASSLWLRKLFGALYEAEPRVRVHESEMPYYALEWGRTMLGFHHGHMRKNEALPALFAAQFREMWGRCPKVYIHTGHRHHKDEKEHPGCFVIQHPTLAARDAHAARGGWWSERAIKAITYHREYGEAGSVTVTPEMLAA